MDELRTGDQVVRGGNFVAYTGVVGQVTTNVGTGGSDNCSSLPDDWEVTNIRIAYKSSVSTVALRFVSEMDISIISCQRNIGANVTPGISVGSVVNFGNAINPQFSIAGFVSHDAVATGGQLSISGQFYITLKKL